MDGRRFDDLARSLATASSRRRVLGGGIAAALAALRGRHSAAAQTCPPGQVPAAGGRCVCRTSGRPPVNGVCPCVNGQLPNCGSACCSTVCCNGTCCDAGQICKTVYLPSPPYTPIGQTCWPPAVGVAVPVEAAWAALTDPEAIAAWALPNDFAPRLGHRFHIWTPERHGERGVIEGEVVEIDHTQKRLAFTWHDPSFPEPATITIALAPDETGEGSLIHVESSGDSTVCRRATMLLGQAWRETYFGQALPAFAARRRDGRI